MRRHAYGLVLETDIPFGAQLHEQQDRPVDWTIRWGDSTFCIPRDPLFAAEGFNWPAWVADGVWYLMSRQTDEAISIDPLDRVVVMDLADRDNDRGALILRGVVASLLLELVGTPVLHANALVVAGNGVAVTGPQGAGKTTSSAALVAGGARLVSDDVVAVEYDSSSVTMRSGPTDLRLRPHGTGVLGLFPSHAATSQSLDGRVVLPMSPFDRDSASLDAIVVPRPSRSTDEISVRALESDAALRLLIGAFRVPGFVERTMVEQRLAAIARLSALPIAEITMPFLDRWTAGDAQALHDELAAWLEGHA